tara:strand:+ start:909 stop:1067 length:159 start_codon:yes stop_codon:yes gene_type:complete
MTGNRKHTFFQASSSVKTAKSSIPLKTSTFIIEKGLPVGRAQEENKPETIIQ